MSDTSSPAFTPAQQVMPLDSIGIREIAEWSSSLRGDGGDQMYMVASPGDKPGTYTISSVAEHDRESGPNDVVVPCNTRLVRPDRPPVTGVTIQAEGMPQSEPLVGYDALFWSEAAVEKFLFPYYASKYQWVAARLLEAMSRAFYGFVPDVASGAGTGDGTRITTFDTEAPIAIAHYPRSDYGMVREDGLQGIGGHIDGEDGVLGIGSDLHVLFGNHETGGITARPLSEYL
ncbi:MAG: hypothetical protein ABW277_15225 [Longimicrobiaceae bacterium]